MAFLFFFSLIICQTKSCVFWYEKCIDLDRSFIEHFNWTDCVDTYTSQKCVCVWFGLLLFCTFVLSIGLLTVAQVELRGRKQSMRVCLRATVDAANVTAIFLVQAFTRWINSISSVFYCQLLVCTINTFICSPLDRLRKGGPISKCPINSLKCWKRVRRSPKSNRNNGLERIGKKIACDDCLSHSSRVWLGCRWKSPAINVIIFYLLILWF